MAEIPVQTPRRPALGTRITRANGSWKLTNGQRDVLRLLALGATDEVIARRLAISVRTAARRVAELKHKLDVTSRVEVPLKASRRGWLD